MVKRVKISSNGPEFSRLVYGTWRLLDSQPTVQEVNRRLQECVEAGITTIDTAEIYGLYEVERVLGKALALSPGLRDRLEIVTKAGIYVPCAYHPDRHTAHYKATGERLVKSLDKSLRFLGIERVDLFLVHRPDWLTPASDTAQGLRQMLENGKSRAVGVSNYSASQFDLLNACLDSRLATNQLEFHLLYPAAMHDGTFHQCEKLAIRPMAWSPLAGGRLFDTQSAAGVRLAKVAEQLADRYGAATLEQLAYAWILQHPSQPLPIVGSNRMDRIHSAAQAAEITLSHEDWYCLLEAAAGQRVP